MALTQRGLNILILPLLTRALGPDDYGAAAVIVATTMVVTIVFGSAVENAIFRWGSPGFTDHDGEPRAVLWLSRTYMVGVVPLLGLVIGAGIVLLGLDSFGIAARLWALETVAVATMAPLSFFALPLLRAREEFRRFVVVSSFTILVTVGLKVLIVVVLDGGLEGWVISDLLAGVTGLAITLISTRVPKPASPYRELSRLVRYSAPLVPHRVSFWALAALDRPLFAAMAPLREVGVYALAASFSAVGVMIIGEVNRGVLAEYARAKLPLSSGPLVSVMRAQVIVLIAAPTALAAGTAIAHPLLVGGEFQGVLPILAVLLAGQLLYGMYLIPTNLAIQTHGSTTRTWLSSGFGAAVMVLGVVILGGRGGSLGVAAAVVSGYAAMALVSIGILSRLPRSFDRWSTVLPRPGTAVIAVGALLLATAALLVDSRAGQVGLAGLSLATLACAGFATVRR